jgi:hypothetical protein
MYYTLVDPAYCVLTFFILFCNVFVRYLRLYPVMRLAFVFYLVFLHLWAFVVLIFHAHSLEHDAFAPPKHPQ